ncbi:MAG: TRAM domain-containing protein, partial [Oscillospiraceae bacterium]|nr:TRAM domain-containing protein [Oscillospiraceae bacterium]
MFAEKLEKVEKNKTYRVEISDLTEDGQGIGKIDGFVVFVEGAIPGDLVEAKIIKVNKSRCYGKLEKIIAPSQSRVVPSCKYSKKCGGCPLMSMEYGAQTEHKRNTIINCLERIGKIAKADKITKET